MRELASKKENVMDLKEFICDEGLIIHALPYRHAYIHTNWNVASGWQFYYTYIHTHTLVRTGVWTS